MHSLSEGAEQGLSCLLNKGPGPGVSKQSQHMICSIKTIFTHKEQMNSNTEKKTFHVKYCATRIWQHNAGHILLTLTMGVN